MLSSFSRLLTEGGGGSKLLPPRQPALVLILFRRCSFWSAVIFLILMLLSWGGGGGQVLPPSLPAISHTRLHDEEIECFFSYFWKDERCCFCRPVVLVCGFCAVRLACVVCLKEMAFNKETKRKKGQVCLIFKAAGDKSVLRALSKEMD